MSCMKVTYKQGKKSSNERLEEREIIMKKSRLLGGMRDWSQSSQKMCHTCGLSSFKLTAWCKGSSFKVSVLVRLTCFQYLLKLFSQECLNVKIS